MNWIEGHPTEDGMYLIRNIDERHGAPVLAVVCDRLIYAIQGNVYEPGMGWVAHQAALRVGLPMEHAHFEVKQ